MRQHSIIRHILMALCAYLAVGVVLAQSTPPSLSLTETQPGALHGTPDGQAALALAREITRYWGAEEVARQLIELCKSAQEIFRAAKVAPFASEQKGP